VDLVPDYKQNVANVYTDMAMRIIRHQKGLFAILNHEEKGLVPGIPTWVPHWSRSFSPLSDYMIVERLRHFLAWPPGPGQFPELIDHYALEVNGLFVDRITGVTKPLVQAETDLAKTIVELETLFGLNDNPFRRYKGDTALADAFWRTMFGDLLYSVDRSMISERITFDRAVEGDGWMFDIARAVRGNELRNRFWIKPDGTLFLDEEIAYIANRARENFWYANEGKVFKTANGYIGSGPPTI